MKTVSWQAGDISGQSHLYQNREMTLKEVIQKEPEKYLGSRRKALYGDSMGVLVKLIDAGERLTVQVHPDKQTAKQLFHSDYGKTECWHMIGGRFIDGEPPCVYLGFKEGMTRKKWEELFWSQDRKGMLEAMNRFEVKAGQRILIEGGVPHAIGAGCFLMEIQVKNRDMEITSLISYDRTNFFCMRKLRIWGTCRLPSEKDFSILYI